MGSVIASCGHPVDLAHDADCCSACHDAMAASWSMDHLGLGQWVGARVVEGHREARTVTGTYDEDEARAELARREARRFTR